MSCAPLSGGDTSGGTFRRPQCHRCRWKSPASRISMCHADVAQFQIGFQSIFGGTVGVKK
jgi:hypothetical protein